MNATGKAVCCAERHESSGSWLDKAREQSTGRHDWSKTDGARLFWCGKAGHIQINCPQKKAKSHTAAAAHIQKEADMGMTGNVAPTDEAQEGETPPEDDDAKREYYSLSEEDLPQVTPGEDEFPQIGRAHV